MRIPRLYKFALAGYLAYAVVTATPEQQTRMIDGGVAMMGAAFEACQREDGLCARAIGSLTATVSQSLTEGPAPWMDDGERSDLTATPQTRPQATSSIRVEPPSATGTP